MNADETTITVTLMLSDGCDLDAFSDRVDEALTIISECPGVEHWIAVLHQPEGTPPGRKDK